MGTMQTLTTQTQLSFDKVHHPDKPVHYDANSVHTSKVLIYTAEYKFTERTNLPKLRNTGNDYLNFGSFEVQII